MNFNKSEKQKVFNELKGKITEINIDEKYSNLTIKVGHQNFRTVNFVAKTDVFNQIINDLKIDDKILVKYYLSSVFKNERYHTTATLLAVDKIID